MHDPLRLDHGAARERLHGLLIREQSDVTPADTASMNDVSVFKRCVQESFEALEGAYLADLPRVPLINW